VLQNRAATSQGTFVPRWHWQCFNSQHIQVANSSKQLGLYIICLSSRSHCPACARHHFRGSCPLDTIHVLLTCCICSCLTHSKHASSTPTLYSRTRPYTLIGCSKLYSHVHATSCCQLSNNLPLLDFCASALNASMIPPQLLSLHVIRTTPSMCTCYGASVQPRQTDKLPHPANTSAQQVCSSKCRGTLGSIAVVSCSTAALTTHSE
jgi:hypothetical protein